MQGARKRRIDHRAAIGLGATAKVEILDVEKISLVETSKTLESGPGHVHQRPADRVHGHRPCRLWFRVQVDVDESGMQRLKPTHAGERHRG